MRRAGAAVLAAVLALTLAGCGRHFYGAYWACKDGSDCTVIAMLGDDPEDYMAHSAVKWLIRLGVNVLTMSPELRHPV